MKRISKKSVPKVQDETEYLLSSPTNKRNLKNALKSIKTGNLIKVDIQKYGKKR